MPPRLFSPRCNFLRREYWWGPVDARPLSAFRIFFALLLLKDALYHIPLARVFYSDAGVVPRSALWGGLARANRFSLMDALPYDWMAVVFFLLWAAVSVCLALGYRTRLMALLNFILLLSLQERNLYVITGADNVMRVLSFWMMFLPLGDYYSLDALRTRWARYARTRRLADLRPGLEPRRAWALPLRLIQIQFALIYLFTALEKQSGVWLRGQALHYTFQLKSLTLPTGDWFFSAAPAWLLKLMTYQALVTEAGFFFLMFLPLAQPGLRALGLALGAALHTGILVSMSIPDFSLVMMIGYFLFFEPEWIDKIESWLRATTGPAALARPGRGHPLWVFLALIPASAVAVSSSIGRTGTEPDEWKIKPAGARRLLSGAEAWTRLAGCLPLSRLWAFVFRRAWARRWCWRLMQGLMERSPLPEPDAGAAETPNAAQPRTLGRALLATPLTALLFGVCWWNVSLLDPGGAPAAPPVSGVPRTVMQYLGLWQEWNMFSPYPRLDDGWMVIPGRFEDGTLLDLHTGRPPSDEMQRWLWGPDERWKKYDENVRLSGDPRLLKPYAEHFCGEYNVAGARPRGTRLATLELHFRLRRSYAPGGAVQPWEDDLLWKHWCAAEYKY